MTNLRKWSQTATGNATIAGGANAINFVEGQLPSTVNNSMREALAQIRLTYKPDEWGWVDCSATASVASQTTFKLTGNQTADYTANRRTRLKSGSTTRYGTIVSSSFTTETTVTITVDSGSLSASHTLAAVAAIDSNHIPANTYVTSNSLSAALASYVTSNSLSAALATYLSSASASAGYERLGVVRGINTQTGTTYEFVLADAGKIVEFNNAAAILATIPSSASVALAVGSRIDVVQYGAGTASFTAGGGVTLRSYTSYKALQGQYAGATLYKRAADEWVLVGNIKA